jgi:hypothetical protein
MVIPHGSVQRLFPPQYQSRYDRSGRFGRLFPTLPPQGADRASFADLATLQRALVELGAKGGPMDGGPQSPDDPNGMPAGFTFFGQFIDHDVTFDPTSSLERQNDPESVANFRTPFLELDNAYGAGPDGSPHLYTIETPSQGASPYAPSAGGGAARIKFLIDEGFPDDLPRNSKGTALIGDPRNDENVIIAQLQLAFLKFHNVLTDRYAGELGLNGMELFRRVQRDVRWHYQNIVVHDFLPRLLGEERVGRILKEGPRFYRPRNEPFIPVEFSVAAYRFGHSMVRESYDVNAARRNAVVFDQSADPANPSDLRGGFRPPQGDASRAVQWDLFFDFDGDVRPQKGKRIDRKLSSTLFDLVPISDPNPEKRSLAVRNLLRGLSFNLPSGQTIAHAIGEQEVPEARLQEAGFGDLAQKAGLVQDTPLWFYILHEADVLGNQGRRLGPVGGTIVGEVLLGLLLADRMSYLRQYPNWNPSINRPQLTSEPVFRLTDLLTIAGVRIHE